MKKKALVLAICMAVSAPAISVAKGLPNDIVGLHLGDIQSSSFLGQTFKGVIPIFFSSTEEIKQLKVSLAPLDIFNKIGAERFPFLESLTFEVGVLNSKPVIFVQSSRPLDMPFMSFVLEMTSAHGTVYQDYTVLIDPSGYQDSKLKNSPLSQASTQKRQRTAVQQVTESKGVNYKVSAGDTLSKISEALKTSQISLKKMIDVIHQANPNAFVNNDIDRLKSGVYLRVPSANKIKGYKFTVPDNTSKNNTKNVVVEDAQEEDSSKFYTVKDGDTLSAITEKFDHQEISFTKRMHAIYNANPDAFSNNKINVLKVGSNLAIPYSMEDIKKANENKIIDKEPEENYQEVIVKEFEDEDDPIVKEFEDEVIVNKSDDEAFGGTTPIDNGATIANEFSSKESESSVNESKETIASKSDMAPLALNESSNVESPPSNDQSVENTRQQSNSTLTTATSKVKSDSTAIIFNLEKRVRELRNNLSESKSKLEYIEEILLTRDIEIKKKSREIKKLKNYFSEELAALAKKEAANKLIAEKNTQPTQKITKIISTAEKSSYLPNQYTGEALVASFLKLKVNQNSDFMVSLKSLSFSDITYGFLALLLGLGLITYRKELHSYVMASDDYPQFYPAEDGQARLNIKESEKGELKTPDTQTTSVKFGVSDSVLAECEKLVDDLYDELHGDPLRTPSNNEKEWESLEKICDNYIEEHKVLDEANEEGSPQFDITLSTKIEVEPEKVDLEEKEEAREVEQTDISFEEMMTSLINNHSDNTLFDKSNPLDGMTKKPREQRKKDRLKKRSTHIEGNYY